MGSEAAGERHLQVTSPMPIAHVAATIDVPRAKLPSVDTVLLRMRRARA
ncbi:hypothetical protein [Microbacterium sp. MPKO10]|nr:hypothetical protein [Microbacterium sp. MPKO10]MCW4457281.1 hypothetical protein [Microbacterium sp. MPKO10]